jgi:hypothetical protein
MGLTNNNLGGFMEYLFGSFALTCFALSILM